MFVPVNKYLFIFQELLLSFLEQEQEGNTFEG